MKRFIKIMICTLVFAVSFLALRVNATEKQFADLYDEISRTDTVIYNNVIWTNIIANTKTTKPAGNVGGYGTNGPVLADTWYGQQINVLSVPRLTGIDGEQKYQVVAWSCFGDQEWDFSGATATAKDFESKHPDYIVLGGINGDFYDWHTTKDYPNCGSGVEMRDGEVIRVTRNSGWAVVGVKNDDSNKQLVFASQATNDNFSQHMFLSIYDENDEIIKEVELTDVNKAELAEGETSAYFGWLERIYLLDELGNNIPNSYGEPTISERIYHAPTMASGNQYVVENGDLVIYQKAEGSYYGIGTITKANESSDVPKSSFGIVTKDPEVEALLAKGVKVRCQYNNIGDFANVTDALGCSHPLIEDGVFSPYYSGESYYTTRAPRTLIGCKADGTICVLTMDGRLPDKNFYGTNQEEIDAVLEQLDITDAYLMDGGGSSTFFVRENNQFVIKNVPSDGAQRSVSNCFLVVTKKDETVKLSNIVPAEQSSEFLIDRESLPESVKDVYIEVNGKKTKFEGESATVSNLKSNTKYDYYLYYETQAGEIIPTTYVGQFTTLKKVPTVSLKDTKIENGYFYPTLDIVDADKALITVTCTIGKANTFVDLDDLSLPVKVKCPADGSDFKCTIVYAYRLGNGQPSVEEEIIYEYTTKEPEPEPEQPTQPEEKEGKNKKKGCRSGALYVSGLVASLGAVVIVLKRKH